jgi:hypothetical protein
MWVQEGEREKLRQFRNILCAYLHTEAQRTQIQTNVYICRYTRWEDLILMYIYIYIYRLGSVVQCWKGQTNLEARVSQVIPASLGTRAHKRKTWRHWFIRLWPWDWRDGHKSHIRVRPSVSLISASFLSLSLSSALISFRETFRLLNYHALHAWLM